MRWWKVLGVAGFAGVAATGVLIARAEIRRRAYTPQEIRQRLRSRVAEAFDTEPATLDSFEVVAGGDQQLSGDLDADPDAVQELGPGTSARSEWR